MISITQNIHKTHSVGNLFFYNSIQFQYSFNLKTSIDGSAYVHPGTRGSHRQDQGETGGVHRGARQYGVGGRRRNDHAEGSSGSLQEPVGVKGQLWKEVNQGQRC